MLEAPRHPQEKKRLEALHDVGILDTPPETSYDEITKLAAEICDVPICLVSLISEDRQWFKSAVGIDATETPREIAFCSHCIVGDEPLMEVTDTNEDKRFHDNPLVKGEPHIRFYAGAPLIDSGGMPLGSLCVIDTKKRELTAFQKNALLVLAKQVSRQLDMRKINKELEVAKAASDRMNEHLTKMVQVISHDLRSPFHGLMGLLDLLVKDATTMAAEERNEIIAMVTDSTHQTFGLLENLLEWSSNTAELDHFTSEEFSVGQIIEQAKSIVEPSFHHKNIHFFEEVEEDARLVCDKRMLSSVVRNLLTNALKFTPKGGKVTVGAKTMGQDIEFFVRDSGIGMDGDQVQSLLKPGISITTPGTTGEQGSGIGMSLVHSFLELHGSKLEIESAPDKGTRASFRISQL